MACPWSGFEPATISFCEDRLCAWVREPANTWSNIGYIVVGLLMVFGAGRSAPHRRPLGAIAILVGVGSTFFHASATFLGEFVDVGSMFVFAWYWLSTLAERRWHLDASGSFRIFRLGLLASLAFLAFVHWAGILLFVALVAAIVVLELSLWRRGKSRNGREAAQSDRVVDAATLSVSQSARVRPYRSFLYLCAAFAVAFVCWALDIRGIWCDPSNHILGGHAVWHLSNSSCFWFLARHLATVHSPSPRSPTL